MTHPPMGRKPLAARIQPAYRRMTDTLNDLGWLPNVVLRLTVGFMFFSGAVGKLGDLGKFTAMFAGLGIPAAQVLAPLTAVVELVGGHTETKTGLSPKAKTMPLDAAPESVKQMLPAAAGGKQ